MDMETIELLDSILQKLDTLEQKVEEQQKQIRDFQNIFYCLFFQKEAYDFQAEEITMKCLGLLLKSVTMGPLARANKRITDECREAAKIAMSDSFSCTEVIEEMLPRVKEWFNKAEHSTNLDPEWLYQTASRKSESGESVKESS